MTLFRDNETGEEIEVTVTSEQSAGEYLEFINTIPAGTPSPPIHAHPRQTEHFEILAGTASFNIEGKRIKLRAGDTTSVEPSVYHTFENAAQDNLQMRVRLSPALDAERMYDGLMGLGMQASPTTALLRLARLFEVINCRFHFRAPISLQKIGFKLLNRLAIWRDVEPPSSRVG